jgi:hypothetical protein
MDGKYDTMDGSSDEVLSTTTKRMQAWVRKEADIHPLRWNGLTYLERIHMPKIWFLILEYQV